MASGEEPIHWGDKILGRNGPGAGVQALGIANHTPGYAHRVRITRDPREINWGDAGRSGFEPGPFRVSQLVPLGMFSVCSSGAGPARAPLARAAAKLEVGWIKGPGEAACFAPAPVPFHQLTGQLSHRYPDLRGDAGVLSRKFFFESCLANVHRELSSSGNNPMEQSRVSGYRRQT